MEFFNLLLLFSLLFYVKRYHLNISISECKPFFGISVFYFYLFQ